MRAAALMVTIEPLTAAGAHLVLGRESRFAARGEALAGVDYFLEHEGVLYPHPLPALADGSVSVYPEAPGRYCLHASWRAADGEAGWSRIAFHVQGAQGLAPQRIKAGGQRLWVPTAWDAQLLVAHEELVFRELQQIIRAGTTVYDVGANVGLFSARFARWIGADGWLYALEPNPVCVYFLRANLEQVGSGNFTILPVAASDYRSDIPFSLNYGSSLIGVGAGSAVARKPGHQIAVEGEKVDALIARLHLRAPDFVKLDVEGAEAAVVAGMMGTLEKHRPGLMVELHGRQAASETLRILAPLNYQYLACATATRYSSADALLDALPEACVQIIAYR
jgi:FkbM family methyltransferase